MSEQTDKPCTACGKFLDENGNEPRSFEFNWWHEECADFDLLRKYRIESDIAYGWDEGDRY